MSGDGGGYEVEAGGRNNNPLLDSTGDLGQSEDDGVGGCLSEC